METIRFGGRPAPGFGVGIAPQSAFVKSGDGSGFFPKLTGKTGAFVSGAAMSAAAAVFATTFFGEETNIGGVKNVAMRLQRNWKVLAATAVAGGVVGAVAK
jgi:hypothetical protein